MTKTAYISDELDRKLEDLKEFGNFGTKVEASKALAKLISKVPLEVIFREEGEKIEKYETDHDYISLSD